MKTIKQVIGIDISKDSFHACLGYIDETQTKGIIKQDVFLNNPKGFLELLKWKEKNKLPNVALSFVVEATGVYYENLAYYLAEHKLSLSVLLPNKSKNFARSLNIKTKTDKVDAAMLCHIGLERTLDFWLLPSVLMRQIKALSRECKTLKVSAAKIKIRLHAYEHSYSPNKSTLKRLHEQKKLLEKQIKQVEDEIRIMVQSDSELYERIQKIEKVKGLSLTTIITVISETNGFAGINNTKQLTSYSGLDVTMNQSGLFKGKTRISKKGNSHIRTALYLPAMSAVRSNLRLKQFYKKIKETKMVGKIGLIAVARKLLILIYTFWKNNVEYDPNLNVKLC